jgi:hypothetical protein
MCLWGVSDLATRTARSRRLSWLRRVSKLAAWAAISRRVKGSHGRRLGAYWVGARVALERIETNKPDGQRNEYRSEPRLWPSRYAAHVLSEFHLLKPFFIALPESFGTVGLLALGFTRRTTGSATGC